MRMIPIYNNVGRMLGNIESKTYVDGPDNITVCEDVSLKPFDPEARIIPDMTANIYRIPKMKIRFDHAWDRQAYTYLVVNSALPDWFWHNRGCVEFRPENFERLSYHDT